jgi:glycosyltransferase involved in cell wall biosynthesis
VKRSQQRLAIVLSHPTQYYSPWFRTLTQSSGLDLRVFYLWEFGVAEHPDPQFGISFKWDVDLLGGYPFEFVPNRARHSGPEHFGGFDNPQLLARLAAWRPDRILLFGYKWKSHLKVIAWARWHRIPLLFRGDSHLLGRGRPGFAARVALRSVFAQVSAFLYVGKANRAYFEALGVPVKKLFFAPHSVNSDLFDPNAAAPKVRAATLRRDYGLPEGLRIALFSGKLIEAKAVVPLLSAFLSRPRPGWALVFSGTGREAPALRAMAGAAPDHVVRFLPFANQTEMPARYLMADLFILPSQGLYETWGLAVNEAMHLGVPALVSDRVGCQLDLVDDGVTGWVFRAQSPESLESKLTEAMAALSGPQAPTFGRAALERIGGYTYESTTQGLLAALESLK